MPQQPRIGDDVSHLFGNGPEIGADVSSLMAAHAGPPTPRGWPATLADLGIGVAKGVGSTLANIAETAANAGVIAGVTPSAFNDAFRDPIFRQADAFTAATNTPQRVGKGLETVAELAAPAMEVGKLTLAGGKALAAKAAPLAASAATAIGAVNPLVLDIAGEVAGHALGTPLGIPTLARRVLGHVLTSARTAAPGIAEATNAGGRVVDAQTPTISQMLADSLAELRKPTPPARITTAPAAELPAGYTPRTTVPKPRAAAAAVPNAEPTPKRAYFLKPPQEPPVPPSASVPSGEVSTDALPASWQSHIGQDIFPLTGKEGTAVADALAEELRTRGMSVGEAMMAVSKNPDIPVQFRQQILKSLSRINLKGGS